MHYTVPSHKEICIKTPYTAHQHTKDAFTAKHQLDLTPYSEQQNITVEETIPLKRAVASFAIIATDIDAYKKLHSELPALTHLKYHASSLITQYNILDGNSCQFSTGESYKGEVSEFTNNDCLITYDYVLMNAETAEIKVSFDIYDDNNTIVNKYNNLKINLKRNELTILRLECLTQGNKGDLGIDDDFDDEIVIPF